MEAFWKKLNDWWQRWKKTSLPNKMGILISVFASALTVVNLVMLRRQIADQDRQVFQITTAISNGISDAKTAAGQVIRENSTALQNTLKESRAALEQSLKRIHADNQTGLNAAIAQGNDTLKVSRENAQAANDIAKLALEAHTRPWVGIDGNLTIKSQIAPNGSASAYFDISFKVRNFGQSPANKTAYRFTAIVDGLPADLVNRSRTCETAAETSKTSSTNPSQDTIFPGIDGAIPKDMGVAVLREPGSRGYQGNPTWLVGCIAYQGAGGVYLTSVVYFIRRVEPYSTTEYREITEFRHFDTQTK